MKKVSRRRKRVELRAESTEMVFDDSYGNRVEVGTTIVKLNLGVLAFQRRSTPSDQQDSLCLAERRRHARAISQPTDTKPARRR